MVRFAGSSPIRPLIIPPEARDLPEVSRNTHHRGGGDHSLMYPDVVALTDLYDKGKVVVIYFDAHI